MAQVVAILKSADIAATVGWYRAAGFDARGSGPNLCEVSRQGLALRFLSGQTPWEGPPTLTGCFYVHVPDVDGLPTTSAVRSMRSGASRIATGGAGNWSSATLTATSSPSPPHDGYHPRARTGRWPVTAESEIATSEPVTSPCWCCAGEFVEADLVHLGARPEVTICLDCARYVHRRASAERDEQRRTPLGVVRGGVQRVRDQVIRNGWHERGPLGALLRRLDRFLP